MDVSCVTWNKAKCLTFGGNRDDSNVLSYWICPATRLIGVSEYSPVISRYKPSDDESIV